MRDNLCVEEKCRKGIEYNKEFIEENRKDIVSLTEDIKNGIQRYPKDNKSIIKDTYLTNFLYEMKDMRAKYSLGENISTMEDEFHEAIYDLENIGESEVGYVNLIWMIALGILLETDKENIERLSKLVIKEKITDAVIDYLLYASDIEWRNISNSYAEENPYAKTKEIIELAQNNKELASQRMQKYMEKEWFQGHSAYGWKNAHKEHGYVGFWSFETAALAKILGLDDSGLKNNIHYPYDLAHYKNSMKFKKVPLKEDNNMDSNKDLEVFTEGIENNPLLEKIIPINWHSFVNELIGDYKVLDDGSFYEKYKKAIGLDQIWFLVQEYEKENQNKNLLGSLIVFALVEKGYIFQLDYKEEVEDYYSNIKNYWPQSETKLIQFQLNNDQKYYALVPKDVDINKMYEITIIESK